MKQNQNCGTGSLPERAPLAAAYVPVQSTAQPRYDASDALTRGTLFPGLDLPFLNLGNETHPCAGTPMGELMAMDFVIKEMNLYLDTHPEDEEAFRFLKEVLALYESGRREFVRRYGPIDAADLQAAERFSWIDAPWPWQMRERSET